MPVDQDTFRALLGRFPSGVTVVTTRDADGVPHGMTVSSFCSVSLEPPLILVCIEKVASMHDLLVESQAFAVNVLADHQEFLSRRFSDEGVAARFDGIGWSGGPAGPVIDDVHAIIECRKVFSQPAGDHTIIVAEVVGGSASNDNSPLAYYRSGYGKLA